MIQPLRVAHRRIFPTLAILLPVVVAAGLGARRVGVRATDISATSTFAININGLPASASVVAASSVMWHIHPIESTFYRDANHPQEVSVVLMPRQEFNEPDLLLYWAGTESSGNALPPGAQLLGAFETGRAMTLPMNRDSAGYLVLFSLAHQRVFDAARLEKLP